MREDWIRFCLTLYPERPICRRPFCEGEDPVLSANVPKWSVTIYCTCIIIFVHEKDIIISLLCQVLQPRTSTPSVCRVGQQS